MGKRLHSLRSVSRRLSFVIVSLIAVVAQFGWIGLGAAHAAGSSLTYVKNDGVHQLTGYPSSFTSLSVQRDTLSVVGTDGKIYTANGVVPNITNVAKAYVVTDDKSTIGTGVGFAVKTDGTLWSWGNALQLGRAHEEMTDDGLVQTDDPNPGQITGLPAIKDIEIGSYHVLALDVNGHVWSWGKNAQDQLGTNNSCQSNTEPLDTGGCSSATRYVPEQIQGLSNVKSISAAWSSSLAVTDSGSLMVWGTVCNIETVYPYYPVPTPYPGVGSNVKQALADGCSMTYLTTSGAVYSWGYAGAYPTAPLLVSALQNIESIETDGWSHYFNSHRIARDVNGIAYRYDATVISPHYAIPVSKIGNIGSSSEYYSYYDDSNADLQGGALVIDYTAPYTDEYIFFNSWTGSSTTFESILPDGTHKTFLNANDQANVSPDGDKIVYVQDCDMYISNLDGSNAVNITNDSENSCAQYPIWSPDGSKIAYTTWPMDGSTQSIKVMDADSGNVSTVMSDIGITGDAMSWSPDSSKLLFDHYPDEEQPLQIGTVKLDGSDIHYYAGVPDSDWGYPAWSPDGSKIAFLSQSRDPETSYATSIMVMSVEGTQSTTLYVGADNVYPHSIAWSPNSQNIAFVVDTYHPSSQKTDTYIYTVPASGGTLTKLNDTALMGAGPIQWWHKSASAPTLAAPANLTIASPTKTPILNWNSVSGTTAYKIYRDGALLTTTSAATYTDSTAAEGTHSYYVTATDGSTESSASNTVAAIVDKTRPTMNFTTPSSFASTFTTGPTVSVVASDTSGLQSMAIHVYTSTNQLLTTCGSANPAQLTAGTMSCSLASLPNGTYYIKAGTFDNADNNRTILSGNFTIEHS